MNNVDEILEKKMEIIAKRMMAEMLDRKLSKAKEEKLSLAKEWFDLREACELKGLNYKTSCNRTMLQPNKGESDGNIGGRKKWRKQTIINWLSLCDEEILMNSEGYSNGK